ncbi:MAG TPA: TIGR04282 family arsenosugar biosynthesis glycosyltransferase [Polyangia bacterium]|nr:TIGR04282 family arsenosugar biosynthesis glycosyltransferase [Polyangia bacterium]
MAVSLPTIPVDRSGEQTPRRAVVVFARSPEDERRAKPLAGRVPGIGGARTETLHRVLIERTLEAAGTLEDADVLLVTTGDLGRARELALRHVAQARLQVLPQAGRSFGERFESAVALAFAAGYHRVVTVGSDTPELDAAALERAFAGLEAPGAARPAVLGPSLDGGYYLLGLSSFSRAPFADIAFGSAEVAADTVAALEQAGYAVDLLAPLPDIDDLQDVGRVATRLSVRRHVGSDTGPGDARLLAALRAVLAAALAFPPIETHRVLSRGELRSLGPRGPPASL